MRSRSLRLILALVLMAVLIGASPVLAAERVVQLLLPNCE